MVTIAFIFLLSLTVCLNNISAFNIIWISYSYVHEAVKRVKIGVVQAIKASVSTMCNIISIKGQQCFEKTNDIRFDLRSL